MLLLASTTRTRIDDCLTPMVLLPVPTNERLDMSGITFEQWLTHTNTLIEEEIGLSLSDLPDCPYRDWFVSQPLTVKATLRGGSFALSLKLMRCRFRL